MEINARNVNQAVNEGFHYLYHAGVESGSRNGSVIVAPEPVMTTYARPTERVLFSPLRDANPWFHMFESLGFLADRADVEFYAYFAKNMRNYSDDGKELWGSYGRRWRSWFGYDQLPLIVEELKTNPDSRRAVLTMWEASDDNDHGYTNDLIRAIDGGRDVPCNTHAYFDLRGGALNMIVLCRSNDMLFGGYGANAVHFSILLEYMAAALSAPVGVYRQFSNNYHVYPATLSQGHTSRESLRELAVDADIHDYYKQGKVKPFPLVNTDIATWDADLARFMATPSGNQKYKDIFFDAVARPMYLAWEQRKEKHGTGLEWARLIGAEDWRRACVEWIVRREAKK